MRRSLLRPETKALYSFKWQALRRTFPIGETPSPSDSLSPVEKEENKI